MRSTRVFLLGVSVAAAFAAGYAFHAWSLARDLQPAADRDAPLIESAEPQLSQADVERHRLDHYAAIDGMAPIIALPTDFSRNEALYALAARADIETLDRYLAETAAVNDAGLQSAALVVFFARYAELDPERALKTMDVFAPGHEHEILDAVFSTWSKLDLRGAIDAVNREQDIQRREIAGEAVLQAHGRSPETLRRIASQLEDELDIDRYAAQVLASQARDAPREAMVAALRLDKPDVRNQSMLDIGLAWASESPLEAYAYGAEIEDLQARQYFISGVMTRWSNADPEAALQSLMSAPQEPEAAEHLYLIMHELARRDPENALRLAGELQAQGLRQAAEQAAIQAWAERDAAAAIQHVDSMPQSFQKRQLEQTLAYPYARQHPDEAIAWARRMPGRSGVQLLASVLMSIAEVDPERALQAAVALDAGAARKQALSSVISNMTWSRPDMAARYVSRLDSGTERSEAIGQIAGAWTERDPSAAAAWAAGLEENLRERAYSAIGSQLAHQNPALAIEYIDQLTGQPRHDLINTIASSYAQKDVGEAVTWITQFEGEPLYAGLVGSIAQSVAAEDPRAALQLTESIPASGDKTSAISSIMYTWADTDPPAAADYAERMSDPAIKLAAVESIVGSWAGYDAVATREWVSQLQPTEVRDQGLLTLITNAAHSPADYLSLIGEIRAETMKADALQQAVQNLAYRDREAARSLLEKSGASTEQKEALQCFFDDPNNFGGS